ncbi:MAG: primase alpha helix C-terminal domain-containing protein, partial [Tepidisphaeraceae bacterium]
MRLPEFTNHKPPTALCDVIDADAKRIYEWAELLPLIPMRAKSAAGGNGLHQDEPVGEVIAEGKRNLTLASLAGTMRHRGMNPDAIVAALLVENQNKCRPPLPEVEVQSIAESIGRYPPAPAKPIATDVATWPEPLGGAAYYGLAGEIVRKIEPHSEADPAALLIHLLVSVGNIIGRTAYFEADGARHYANLFTVNVGQTSKGRKGTASRQIERLLKSVTPTWADKCTVEGLSSGEGLIWAVRDAIHQRQPVKEKGRVVDYEDVEVDPGVADKRLLVTESEFAGTLKVAQRETNTLSPVIRRAWDSGNLRTLTKNSPAIATGAHISIIAHITRDELRRTLDTTETANGFCNRFLWFCVRRSKCLPEGGAIHDVDFGPEVRRLAEAVEANADATLITRDAA